ncbi:ATP-grasp peptide maturase system methyltransferase [Microtetraspora sp. NBRC 13810]|uniref:ATP-grasp peptide maturase system methyltransferase n=1 Tax=Microtetraspora sp. NBRC 13810 TaxID=3030990 RepID=UPI002553D22B|nr:ATP-grasp peptide maturase system methyltransferase [Microtetraspora sp. NBRC 13810]
MNEAQLRRRLADQLQESGALRSPQWRAAVERIPRHLFIPEFFRSVITSEGMMWESVTPKSTGIDELMTLAYENKTWVTQIDGHIYPGETEKPVPAGNPTSSSTLPALVVAMLEDLDVGDDSKVMEIGTGTGYSTALLCERVGAENVVSIETDAGLAARAARAIHQTGHNPTLITGDGLDGFRPRAPYDRIIATCSVRHIPAAWIAQSKPGATILTTLSGWQYGSGYVRLTVEADGTASGRFLPDTYSFMPARPHMPPPVDLGDTKEIDAGEPRPAVVHPDTLHDWTAQFVAQLATPGAQCVGKSVDGGPWVDYYVDAATGSIAAVTPQDDGMPLVREIGPVAIWSSIESAITDWREIGSPGIDEFRIIVTPGRQTVLIPAHESFTWRLPQ